jgi:hypothetical protein
MAATNRILSSWDNARAFKQTDDAVAISCRDEMARVRPRHRRRFLTRPCASNNQKTWDTPNGANDGPADLKLKRLEVDVASCLKVCDKLLLEDVPKQDLLVFGRSLQVP